MFHPILQGTLHYYWGNIVISNAYWLLLNILVVYLYFPKHILKRRLSCHIIHRSYMLASEKKYKRYVVDDMWFCFSFLPTTILIETSYLLLRISYYIRCCWRLLVTAKKNPMKNLPSHIFYKKNVYIAVIHSGYMKQMRDDNNNKMRW